jgi:hypothetical protein
MRMKSRWRATPIARIALTALSMQACTGHTDPFQSDPSDVGPQPTVGGAIRITFNGEQDYWPVLAEDSTVVLYAFVDSTVANQPVAFGHRCIGALPAVGGTRFWQWCDNRTTLIDSMASFPAFALGRDGRLLYVEATATPAHPLDPQSSLWLADSVKPFVRRELMHFPFPVGDSSANWISAVQWTGPATFIGLAQDEVPMLHCPGCTVCDSLFFGLGVVIGTTAGTGSVALIGGTQGATSYSVANRGTSVAFTRRNDGHLFTVPIGGGTATAAAVVSTDPASQLLGVSCRGVLCVVATGTVQLSELSAATIRAGAQFREQATGCGTDARITTFPNRINSGPFDLRSVNLTTGAVTLLASPVLPAPQIYSMPVLLASGDVVVQVGSSMGPLQTLSASTVDLWRLPRLAPASP